MGGIPPAKAGPSNDLGVHEGPDAGVDEIERTSPIKAGSSNDTGIHEQEARDLMIQRINEFTRWAGRRP